MSVFNLRIISNFLFHVILINVSAATEIVKKEEIRNMQLRFEDAFFLHNRKVAIKDTLSDSTSFIIKLFDYETKLTLEDIPIYVSKKNEKGEVYERLTLFTDNRGEIYLEEPIIDLGNLIVFVSTEKTTLDLEIEVNDKRYKTKILQERFTAGKDLVISVGLMKIKEFKQEIDDFKPGLYVPETYKSTFFTIYGQTKTPLENDEKGALKLARKHAYLQFVHTLQKKFRENEIIKDTIPEGGKVVFKFPPNQDMYYYIVKYKRSELKKFVKSLLKVKDDVEIEDEPKTNEDLVFEDISLNTALLKSKTQGKNIFILVANDGTNMDDVLKVLNEDKVFVKNTNDTKVRIRIEVDTDSEDYGLLRDIIRDNGLSMRSHPRVIYMNKDKKILANYDYYTITTDGKYKL